MALHYLRITIGLYVGELALSLLCWLPRPILRRDLHALCPDTSDGTPGMSVVADRDVLVAAALAQIRIDAIAVVALYGGAFALYGARWPILAALLVVRAFISSQLDHAPHHGTPLDRRDHALNLSAPRWLQHVLLNFNFHRTHHRHPHLPWRSLPALADTEPGDIAFASAVLRQWRGPDRARRLRCAFRTPPRERSTGALDSPLAGGRRVALFESILTLLLLAICCCRSRAGSAFRIRRCWRGRALRRGAAVGARDHARPASRAGAVHRAGDPRCRVRFSGARDQALLDRVVRARLRRGAS